MSTAHEDTGPTFREGRYSEENEAGLKVREK